MEPLRKRITAFVNERDWEKFHSPKNLAIGLSIEASELLEVFLWLSEEESRTLDDKQLVRLKEEIGDVMIYLVSLAEKFGLDPVQCAEDKIELNSRKYPVEAAKGSAKKYTDFGK
jgi:dCTP diphosphatase